MIPIDLSSKTAIVTGGGQGLGAATASLLREAGANVVVNYLPDPAGVNLQRAEETVSGWGEHGAIIDADVRDAGAVKAMIEHAVARFGRLDIVVNNAGILRDRTTKNMQIEEWQAVIDANLTGVFNVCQAAIEPLSDGGRIVSMSSISAALGIYGQANYAAAKAGIVGLTKACELLLTGEMPDPAGVGMMMAAYPKWRLEANRFETERCRMLLPLVWAVTTPDNRASIRGLEKLGLKFERMVRLSEEEPEIGLYGPQP